MTGDAPAPSLPIRPVRKRPRSDAGRRGPTQRLGAQRRCLRSERALRARDPAAEAAEFTAIDRAVLEIQTQPGGSVEIVESAESIHRGSYGIVRRGKTMQCACTRGVEGLTEKVEDLENVLGEERK